MNNRNIKQLSIITLTIILLIIVFFLIPLPFPPEKQDALTSCRIFDRNGFLLREILSYRSGTSCYVSIKDISPYLIKATLISEDKRFYDHIGIDPIAISRALFQNIRQMSIVSGGSTITQQLAKLTYGNHHNRLISKALEICYSIKIESVLNKNKILELYLNRIPYSNQIFGIETASRTYFDKSAKDISLAQSAFLASIPQAPSLYDPYENKKMIQKKQRNILKDLFLSGQIDLLQFKNAIKEPITISPDSYKFNAPHFCDYITTILKEKKIKNVAIVETTLDLELQKNIEKILSTKIRSLKDRGVTNGAVIVMDNSNGDILAMVGSIDYKGIEGQVNAALSKRQPGSTIKPFTYALALENGYTASDIIPDLKTSINTENGDFTPVNYDNVFHGPVRLRKALACSYNVPAVRVLQKLGPEFLYNRLKLSNFDCLSRSADFYGVGLTLGSCESTLLELTRAYSMFSRSGIIIPENIILTMKTPEGKIIQNYNNFCDKRIFDPEICYIITDILKDNEARAPAFGRFSSISLPFQCAVKTGTSKGYRDNWTIGYTPSYTVGVWVGNFDATPMRNVSGITGAGPIFAEIMKMLEKDKKEEFIKPENIIEEYVCPASGKLPNEYCPDTIREIYVKGNTPSKKCEVHRMLTIDLRTGYKASATCPEKYKLNKLFEIYPPLFAEWMNEHGLKNPFLCSYNAENKYKLNTQASIIFPKDGDTFKIDPVLRKEFQKIHLKALVPENVSQITWIIDGKPAGISKYPFIFEWQLKKGSHIVEIKELSKSEKVSFIVQ